MDYVCLYVIKQSSRCGFTLDFVPFIFHKDPYILLTWPYTKFILCPEQRNHSTLARFRFKLSKICQKYGNEKTAVDSFLTFALICKFSERSLHVCLIRTQLTFKYRNSQGTVSPLQCKGMFILKKVGSRFVLNKWIEITIRAFLYSRTLAFLRFALQQQKSL